MDSKINQNKPRYDLDRWTANISALSWGNVSKYEALANKNILPEEDLLEKADAINKF